MQLCSAIDTRRGSLLIRITWHVIWLFAKHIICGNVNQKTINLLHGKGEICGCLSIQFLCQSCKLRVCLAGINISPCSTVNDNINVMLVDNLPYVIHIGDIKAGRLYTILLRYVSKEKIM